MATEMDVPPFWRSDIPDGGMQLLADAAVPKEVQDDLKAHLGETGVRHLLHALASPPSSVTMRCTMPLCGTAAGDVEACWQELASHIKASLSDSERQMACSFSIEKAPPLLNCPEARRISGTGHREEEDTAEADVIIDAACAMAVLRGADVFCMGVMATSQKPEPGQRARLWVAPEGVKPPCRGSIVGSPQSWPAVLVAGGRLLLPRAEIFAAGARGTAVQALWRRGLDVPLAPMNQVLANAQLSGKVVLQQLPSNLCARVLQPCMGHQVLDMCAAPGGKTTHLAQMLGNGGQGLTAVDRSLAKVRRVKALCQAHGFTNVRCIASDSRHLLEQSEEQEAKSEPPSESHHAHADWPPEAEQAFKEAVAQHGADRFRSSKRIWKAVLGAVGRGTVTRMQLNARLRVHEQECSPDTPDAVEAAGQFASESFDRILLDPPCSAMGQRPLLRWGKSLQDIQSHAEYQRQFLHTASKLLRPGGELVYSTCTLTPAENEANVCWALQALPLQLLDARANVVESSNESLAGLPNCGLSEDQRMQVLRFDPRSWDAGFFIARFRKADLV